MRMKDATSGQDAHKAQPRPTTGPARGTKANRPRTTSPPVHDPGGRHKRRKNAADDEIPPILDSYDLAESFLESEPREERLDLQAAIASQSQTLQDSAVSSIAESQETGIGSSEGVSLPTFIANFFKGIGDRLQVSIREAAITLEMEVAQELNGIDHFENGDTVKMILKISEIVLDRLDPELDTKEARVSRRRFRLFQLCMILLSDGDVCPKNGQNSATSFPGLSRSKVKLSSVEKSTSMMTHHSSSPDRSETIRSTLISTNERKGLDSRAENDNQVSAKSAAYSSQSASRYSDLDSIRDPVSHSLMSHSAFSMESSTPGHYQEQLSGSSSSDSVPAFASVSGSAMDSVPPDRTSTTVEALRLANMPQPQTSLFSADLHQSVDTVDTIDIIDNRNHAEMLAQAGQIDDKLQNPENGARSSVDLTQSRIFSHEEAESMYMSAVSNRTAEFKDFNTLPGGWNWSEPSSPPLAESAKWSPIVGDTIPGPAGEEGTASTCPPTSITASSSSPRIEHDLSSTSNVAFQGRKGSTSPRASESTEQIARRLITIDQVSIWVPFRSSGQQITSNAASLDAGSEKGSPQSPAKRTTFTDKAKKSNPPQSVLHSAHQHPTTDDNSSLVSPALGHVLEIEIAKVHAQLDLQVVKVLALCTKNLMSILDAQERKSDQWSSPKTSHKPSLGLKLSNIFVDFREHVPEHMEPVTWLSPQNQLPHLSSEDLPKDPHTPERHFNAPLQPQMQDQTEEGLLIRLTLTGLSYKITCNREHHNHILNVTKMTLSHTTGDILVFRHDIKLRESIKDISAATEDDVFVSITSTDQINQVVVQVKLLHLKLDLLNLEDILNRSGGLSSLLELGNSIVSTSTVRSSSKNSEHPESRSRGVRFAPVASPGILDQSNSAKVNVRVAGTTLELVGSETITRVRSSPVKIVYRPEGLAMQIDHTTIEGPILPEDDQLKAIRINVRNIRVEYLIVPREADLDQLLSIITPTKDKYDDDDDIMVDTLLRQRRQGGVLRSTVDEVEASMEGFSCVDPLLRLAIELGKLSTVTKYLPEDDRPGILSLALIRKLDLRLKLDDTIGTIRFKGENMEGAHVSVPSLMATQVSKLSLLRNDDERMLGQAVSTAPDLGVPPMIMCRFVADEMEPTIKLKLYNTCVEYRVSTLIALTSPNSLSGRSDAPSGLKDEPTSSPPVSTASSSHSEMPSELAKRAKIAMAVRDCAFALNPNTLNSKGLIVLSEASLLSSPDKKGETTLGFDIKKASIMVIDKVENISATVGSPNQQIYFDEGGQTQHFVASGFVPVGYVSAASAAIKLTPSRSGIAQSLDVELRNNLLILETCADSTQTLIGILNGLSPPTPLSDTTKYRTEVVPIEDMLASFTGDAFVAEPGPEAGLRARSGSDPDSVSSEQPDIEYVSEFYHAGPEDESDPLEGSYVDSEISESMASVSTALSKTHKAVVEATGEEAMIHSLLDFRDDHFARTSTVGSTAHRWDSAKNTYGLANENMLHGSPLRVRVRDVHIIWNLFDGYDWQSTRDTISHAVRDIETRASARRPRSMNRLSSGAVAEEEDESVIGDFLFNSIYIGIPANKDPHELANNINRNIDDLTSDTGSYATTTTVTASPARHQRNGSKARQKRLRLTRSKHHKMTFELEGISADVIVFPPGSSEVESSVDVRIKKLEIFDHLPTSTWRKFATYMQDAGERESDTNMIHLELLNVKPVADLAASEMILKVTVLPLRLHVDQDALDFMSRFFEFKDESVPKSPPSTPPFLQRVEVNPIRVRLDFKPKRVDYGGLRSGRTTEFMNFFVLDRADMVLRRVILYGVSGYDRLGIMLNNIWSPDVKANQLPGILAGLAPIRSIVNVGSGVRDLVVVPMKEYQKDGRIVRSIQKGAVAFAKTTTKELVNLGAKLAIGTQTVLQNTETMLSPGLSEEKWDELSIDDDSKKQISLYADQPIGVIQGLRGAYASLERDLLLARDAIVAVPGEVMASGSASGAAKAVLKQTPTIILRPAIGVSKAVGQTLLGAGNTLDRHNWRRMEEVSPHGISNLGGVKADLH